MSKEQAAELDRYRKHENRARSQNWPFAFPKVRIVSFPRSGRSWIKFMTQHVMLASGKRFQRCEGLAMFKHDGAGIHIANRKKYYQQDKRQFYGKRRVALIVRNPLDVCVSGWHLLRHRMRQNRYKKWSLDEYVQLDRGLPFIVEWMNDWAAQRKVPEDFIVFRYEDFLADPVEQLLKFVAWIGLEDVPRYHFTAAVDAFSFDRMREHDKHFLMPGIDGELGVTLDRDLESSYAVRKGGQGGWREELAPETQEWALGYLQKNLHDYWSMYKDGSVLAQAEGDVKNDSGGIR